MQEYKFQINKCSGWDIRELLNLWSNETAHDFY